VFVQKSIAPKFIESLKAAFKGAEGAFGANPADPTTVLGPLADKLQYDRVMSFIQSGKTESGAELIVGGGKIEGKEGLFVQPTIFMDGKDDAKIYREEIFGPVLHIKTFETEEEAIKLANDTSYGLSCKFFQPCFVTFANKSISCRLYQQHFQSFASSLEDPSRHCGNQRRGLPECRAPLRWV
jgi:aldehyde dehydrogenase (NAD+)